MGKTNEERASINKRRIEEVIKMWEHDYCIAINDNNRTWLTIRISSLVNYLITKAEKRGMRNERKKVTSEVCIFCPGLNNGECPNVNSTVISKDEQIRVLSEQIDFMEDQIEELEKQQEHTFDADEVLGLIDALRDFAVDVGSGKHAQWCMEEARRRLLSALSLEDK